MGVREGPVGLRGGRERDQLVHGATGRDREREIERAREREREKDRVRKRERETSREREKGTERERGLKRGREVQWFRFAAGRAGWG